MTAIAVIILANAVAVGHNNQSGWSTNTARGLTSAAKSSLHILPRSGEYDAGGASNSRLEVVFLAAAEQSNERRSGSRPTGPPADRAPFHRENETHACIARFMFCFAFRMC